MTELSKKLFSIVSSKPSDEFIANLNTKIVAYELDGQTIIVTIGDKIIPNCYVASPYALIIEYSKQEAKKVGTKFEYYMAKSLINLFGFWLKLAKIDKVQTLNNQMLSTNFYSQYWEGIDIKALEELVIPAHKKHALILRSVNNKQNPNLYKNCQQQGWLPIVSRQVYIFDDFKKCAKRHNFKMDQKLLNSERFIFKAPKNSEDFEVAEKLYNQLYLQKYPIENVQFRSQYLQQLVETGLMHLRLLWDCEAQQFVAVVGMIGEDGVITAPLVGYDISAPKANALYRRVIAYALKYAKDNDYILNLSSGSSSFKRLRGGVPHLEYMLVKTQHLSFYQRMIWKILQFISQKFYAPLLQKYKL